MGGPPEANRAFSGAEQKDNSLLGFGAWGLNYLIPFNSCFILPERMAAVELFFGEYYGTITEPGCYCRNSCAVEVRRVSTALTSIDLPNVKVLDSSGTPVLVSAIVTFEVVDARRAALEVHNAFSYVKDQAPAVLKRVVSEYPYEPPGDQMELPSLRTETETVSARMKEQLQNRVLGAGVRVESFMLNELSYAPEIARAMLKRQQATALVEARHTLVSGAIDITEDAMGRIGGQLEPAERSKLLSNMLVVLVGDKEAQPTVPLG